METTQNSSYAKLRSIDVSSKVEKKEGLSYLSWAWAWDEFKQHCPDATYEVVKTPEGIPYFNSQAGAMVYTRVTVEGQTHEMWLPVMDGKNKAMKDAPYFYRTKFGEKEVEAFTMFDVNKAIMRCLVKNLAMFGLGLYIYAGEDLPEAEAAPPANPLDAIPTKPAQPEQPQKIPQKAEERIDHEDAMRGGELGQAEVWPLLVPGKDQPVSTHPSFDEWSLAYEDLADRTARAGKVAPRDRMTKLRELKEANQHQLDRLDPVQRIPLMASYQKRLKALGAANAEVPA